MDIILLYILLTCTVPQFGVISAADLPQVWIDYVTELLKKYELTESELFSNVTTSHLRSKSPLSLLMCWVHIHYMYPGYQVIICNHEITHLLQNTPEEEEHVHVSHTCTVLTR